jgi:hypothetical protein
MEGQSEDIQSIRDKILIGIYSGHDQIAMHRYRQVNIQKNPKNAVDSRECTV